MLLSIVQKLKNTQDHIKKINCSQLNALGVQGYLYILTSQNFGKCSINSLLYLFFAQPHRVSPCMCTAYYGTNESDVPCAVSWSFFSLQLHQLLLCLQSLAFLASPNTTFCFFKPVRPLLWLVSDFPCYSLESLL